jgi:hypothetical protein
MIANRSNVLKNKLKTNLLHSENENNLKIWAIFQEVKRRKAVEIGFSIEVSSHELLKQNNFI